MSTEVVTMKDIDRVITICPRCAGNKAIRMMKTKCHEWKLRKYFMLCDECGYCTSNAFTHRGAVKKWNKVNPQVVKAIKAGTPPRGTKGEDA